MHLYVHTHTHNCIYIHTRIFLCIYSGWETTRTQQIGICTHTHIYVYLYTNTHIHICTQRLRKDAGASPKHALLLAQIAFARAVLSLSPVVFSPHILLEYIHMYMYAYILTYKHVFTCVHIAPCLPRYFARYIRIAYIYVYNFVCMCMYMRKYIRAIVHIWLIRFIAHIWLGHGDVNHLIPIIVHMRFDSWQTHNRFMAHL